MIIHLLTSCKLITPTFFYFDFVKKNTTNNNANKIGKPNVKTSAIHNAIMTVMESKLINKKDIINTRIANEIIVAGFTLN